MGSSATGKLTFEQILLRMSYLIRCSLKVDFISGNCLKVMIIFCALFACLNFFGLQTINNLEKSYWHICSTSCIYQSDSCFKHTCMLGLVLLNLFSYSNLHLSLSYSEWQEYILHGVLKYASSFSPEYLNLFILPFLLTGPFPFAFCCSLHSLILWLIFLLTVCGNFPSLSSFPFHSYLKLLFFF